MVHGKNETLRVVPVVKIDKLNGPLPQKKAGNGRMARLHKSIGRSISLSSKNVFPNPKNPRFCAGRANSIYEFCDTRCRSARGRTQTQTCTERAYVKRCGCNYEKKANNNQYKFVGVMKYKVSEIDI